jgi:hypothetical protein
MKDIFAIMAEFLTCANKKFQDIEIERYTTGIYKDDSDIVSIKHLFKYFKYFDDFNVDEEVEMAFIIAEATLEELKNSNLVDYIKYNNEIPKSIEHLVDDGELNIYDFSDYIDSFEY